MKTLAPPAVTLRQLQYLVAVAETGGFRTAAELCRVAQPSLSAQVAAAEDALGVVVFERTSRGVRLTHPGAALVERARRVLREADDLFDASRRLSDPLAGTVRVGVIPTIAPYLLPDIVPSLHDTFPRLTLAWVEEKTDVLLSRLEDGGLDAALLAAVPGTASYASASLGPDAFVLAAPRGHALLKGKGPLPLADLAHAPMLLLEEGHCLRDQALSVCATAHVEEQELRATSLPTLAQMVSSGAGLTLLPEMAVATEVRRARLGTRELAPSPTRDVVLVWRPSSPLADTLLQLGAAMREARPTR